MVKSILIRSKVFLLESNILKTHASSHSSLKELVKQLFASSSTVSSLIGSSLRASISSQRFSVIVADTKVGSGHLSALLLTEMLLLALVGVALAEISSSAVIFFAGIKALVLERGSLAISIRCE